MYKFVTNKLFTTGLSGIVMMAYSYVLKGLMMSSLSQIIIAGLVTALVMAWVLKADSKYVRHSMRQRFQITFSGLAILAVLGGLGRHIAHSSDSWPSPITIDRALTFTSYFGFIVGAGIAVISFGLAALVWFRSQLPLDLQ